MLVAVQIRQFDEISSDIRSLGVSLPGTRAMGRDRTFQKDRGWE